MEYVGDHLAHPESAGPVDDEVLPVRIAVEQAERTRREHADAFTEPGKRVFGMPRTTQSEPYVT